MWNRHQSLRTPLFVGAAAGACLASAAFGQQIAQKSDLAVVQPPAIVQFIDPNVAPAPVPVPRTPGAGSCIHTNPFSCSVLTQADCLAEGGTWTSGAVCPDNPVGVCTAPTGDCQTMEYPRVAGTSRLSQGDLNNANRVADAFRTAAAGNMNQSQICWWGTYAAIAPAPAVNCTTGIPTSADSFVVTYLAVAGGLPDTVNPPLAVYRQSDATLTVSKRNLCDTGGRLTVEYSATHAALALNPSTCYFVEIRNAANSAVANWFWSHSLLLADNTSFQTTTPAYTLGGVGTGTLGDRAWCMNADLDIFQDAGLCAAPPPPICSNPDANGQPFSTAVNTGGFSASPSPGAIGLQLADRFQFINSGNISNVCFRGFWVAQDNTQPAGPDAPDFDVTYFANNNGQPGAVLAAYHVGNVGVNVFRVGFQYRIEHPPLAVTAGTCYFISISRLSDYADPNHNLRFAWWLTAPGAVGDDRAHARAAAGATPGPWGTIAFGVGIGDIHFLFNEGPVQTPNCPVNTGTCCNGTTCTNTTEAVCLAGGGIFGGVGTNCNAGSCLPPPANDACEQATTISGLGTFPFDNRAATIDGAASCADPTSSHDVWFRWNAPCAGDYTFAACGLSTADLVMSVHDGTTPCPTPVEIGCDDDGCGPIGGPSTVAFTAAAGQSFLLRVATWNLTDGAAASFSLARAGGDCPIACPCDFNHSGAVNSQDFFDFLNCFFTPGCAAADFNGSGSVNSQDFFDFLNCFFNPPPGC